MHASISKWFEQHDQEVKDLSRDLWEHPEAAMQEFYACERVAEFMRLHGFDVTELDILNRGKKPNCVIAKYGSGKPVIGILGELDALNGLGNDSVPYRSERPGPGHGCGHNLLAAGCAGAAAALKLAMADEGLTGTIIYYGCPAEETLDGKVHMAGQGLFNDLDLCLTYHPATGPVMVSEGTTLASTNLQFKFYGTTAHAAANPQDGRSALDAAELMNVGVNYLREHVTDDVRIHYVYINGGEAANIVPGYAELNYFVRSSKRENNNDVVQRVIDCAKGASIMTGTRYEAVLNAGCYEFLVNHKLAEVLYGAAGKVPDIVYTDEDRNFADQLYTHLKGEPPKNPLLYTGLRPLVGAEYRLPGSSDLGDVSQMVPTVNCWDTAWRTSHPGTIGPLWPLRAAPSGRRPPFTPRRCLPRAAWIFCKIHRW
ncbi:MAG: amidohydrolase [Clostridiaceae bacterium]|nr:amidohydrolase [Eubacteriales bacterium]